MSVQAVNAEVCEIHRRRETESNYEKTLVLLKALKDGKLTTNDFEMVDGGAGGWKFVIPQAEPPFKAVNEPESK